MTKAKDVMKKKVFRVTPNMTLREISGLFTDRHITGAPVVDREGKLIGVVSQTDLVRQEREAMPAAEAPIERGRGPQGFQIESPDYARVKEVMTPTVLSVDENTPIRDVAKKMVKRKVHRLMVMRDGKVTGIVTSMDIVGLLAKGVWR